MFQTSRGGGKHQSFTQAAPNELKLSEGRQTGDGRPSAWLWWQGIKRGQGTINDEMGVRAVVLVQLKPDFKAMQVSSKYERHLHGSQNVHTYTLFATRSIFGERTKGRKGVLV